MTSPKYQRVDQTCVTSSKEEFANDEHVCPCQRHMAHHARTRNKLSVALVMLCFLIISNTVLLGRLLFVQDHAHDPNFVGLERNVQMKILHDERTIDDAMWDSPEFNVDEGWIALDNDLAERKGLPTAMLWPWDESKSIYVVHAYHSLHCVMVLRDAIRQYRDAAEQAWPFEHVTHCLHVLREDTTCNADDTPRYTGRLHAQVNSSVLFSGVGQPRMCRDWSELRRFAVDNSACYKRPRDHYIPLLDRYKFCPDGKTPWLDGSVDSPEAGHP